MHQILTRFADHGRVGKPYRRVGRVRPNWTTLGSDCRGSLASVYFRLMYREMVVGWPAGQTDYTTPTIKNLR